MIYTDGQHTVADCEGELHDFFKNVMKFKREWYHDKKKNGQPSDKPHYDVLTASKRKFMLKQKNVVLVDKKMIPELARKMFKLFPVYGEIKEIFITDIDFRKDVDLNKGFRIYPQKMPLHPGVGHSVIFKI